MNAHEISLLPPKEQHKLLKRVEAILNYNSGKLTLARAAQSIEVTRDTFLRLRSRWMHKGHAALVDQRALSHRREKTK